MFKNIKYPVTCNVKEDQILMFAWISNLNFNETIFFTGQILYFVRCRKEVILRNKKIYFVIVVLLIDI